MTDIIEDALELPPAVVHRREGAQELAQRWTEGFERSLLIGEQRVSSGWRDHDGTQDRTKRWPLHERDIRVPADTAIGSADIAVRPCRLARRVVDQQ
jgi:hypothetical protein